MQTERARQNDGKPTAFEVKGQLELNDIGMTVTARADRIDVTQSGGLIIYDYKTGSAPSPKEQMEYERQLLIEAVIAENAGFDKLEPSLVSAAWYISVKNDPDLRPAPLDDAPTAQVRDELRQLLASYLQAEQGYLSRRAPKSEANSLDYDQLARFGEWEASDIGVPEVIK